MPVLFITPTLPLTTRNFMKFFRLLLTIVIVIWLPTITFSAEVCLWYRQPAEHSNQALPVGNGRLGAMVHGRVEQELLQLNEDTVWSGNQSNFDRVGAYKYLPAIREMLFSSRYAEAEQLVAKEMLGDRPMGAYQPLSDLTLDFDGGGEVSDYRRELDLDTAIARIRYRQGDAVFTREIFVSAPAQVLVVRLTCDKPDRISLTAQLSRREGASAEAPSSDRLVLRGQADRGKPTAGVKFLAQLRAVTDGGKCDTSGVKLHIDSADAVTLLLAAKTNFCEETDLLKKTSQQLDAAARARYETLRDEHVADYRQFFRRVELQLGTNESSPMPTNERLDRVKAGASDPDLVALYFQYARYLLISSSRPGTMATNLQGIWNDDFNPSWFCGYHFDVNTQMNYWPAEVVNLSECHTPLFDLIDRLRKNGRKTARDVYNCRGFVVSHRTNGNFFTSPVSGFTTWPTGAGWLCQHLWEHYRFTHDKEFLANRAYPVMRDAAEFCLDWLVKDPRSGLMVSGPSISPENRFLLPDGSAGSLTMGPAMDQQIIGELFDNCLAAAAALEIDDEFVAEVRFNRARLAEPKIASDRRLMEWNEEQLEREPGHRHYSHLYALHPGWSITPRSTPELAEAARNSLVHRLTRAQTGPKVNISDSSSVGWSLAWTIGLWSRLGDAQMAHDAVMALLKRCTFPNLLDFHPKAGTPGVFQIDGNLGGAAGVAEMLLQSHAGEIDLLPALPQEWSTGSLKGLRARGGFEVDIEWNDGWLKSAVVRASVDGHCRIRYGTSVLDLLLEAGESRTLTSRP